MATIPDKALLTGDVSEGTYQDALNQLVDTLVSVLGQTPATTLNALSTAIATIQSDARWTNARTPTAHKATHATGGADAISVTDIGALASTDVTATATANKVLRLDGNGRLPADITGNAVTATSATTAPGMFTVSLPGSTSPVLKLINYNGTAMVAKGYSTDNSLYFRDGTGVVVDTYGKDVYSNGLKCLADSAHSLDSNGYQKLSNGLVFQWGTISSTTDSAQVFAFPMTFTSVCLGVFLNRQVENADAPLYATSITTTGFTINRKDGIGGANTVNFFAIGY